MLFCPKCCNLLLLKKGSSGMSGGNAEMFKGGCITFDCQYCHYSHEISKPFTNTISFDRKKVDDVFGGADSWKNVDSIEVTCPKCENDRAYYMQIQIRSADEPSTIFYKCCDSKCSNQWREG